MTLRSDKSLGYIIVLFCLGYLLNSLSAFADSSVWKVSKNNHHIYLGGTVHTLPSSQFPLPEEFDIAFKQSDAVVLETQLPSGDDKAFQQKFMQQVTYQGQVNLSNFISPQTYQMLKQYLSDNGMNIEQLAHFKPGFLVSMLTLMAAEKAKLKGDGVDVYFDKLAQRHDKPVEFLETIDFQIALLANIGRDNEDQLIKSTLSQLTHFQTMFSQLLLAWRNGDVKALEKLVIQPIRIEDPKSFKTMIINRNRDWLPKIEAMFQDKDIEFVLVGVAHLVGNGSVIELLREQGYQVTKL